MTALVNITVYKERIRRAVHISDFCRLSTLTIVFPVKTVAMVCVPFAVNANEPRRVVTLACSIPSGATWSACVTSRSSQRDGVSLGVAHETSGQSRGMLTQFQYAGLQHAKVSYFAVEVVANRFVTAIDVVLAFGRVAEYLPAYFLRLERSQMDLPVARPVPGVSCVEEEEQPRNRQQLRAEHFSHCSTKLTGRSDWWESLGG